MWSCGGGVQSSAIAALIIQEKLERPDFSVIVDTGYEKSTTWAWVDAVLTPRLAEVGVELIRIRSADWVDNAVVNDDGKVVIPAFAGDGEGVKFPTWCSGVWKGKAVERFLRKQGVQKAQNWLGISTDEIRRVRQSNVWWLQRRFPLIFDVPMDRAACVRLVESMGWPTPPQTCCWMCPNMRPDEWERMRQSSPDDFAKAVAMEEHLQKFDNVWLTRKRIPLPQFKAKEESAGLFDAGCESGQCFT